MTKYDKRNVDAFVEDVKSNLSPEDSLRLLLATAWQQRSGGRRDRPPERNRGLPRVLG